MTNICDSDVCSSSYVGNGRLARNDNGVPYHSPKMNVAADESLFDDINGEMRGGKVSSCTFLIGFSFLHPHMIILRPFASHKRIIIGKVNQNAAQLKMIAVAMASKNTSLHCVKNKTLILNAFNIFIAKISIEMYRRFLASILRLLSSAVFIAKLKLLVSE